MANDDEYVRGTVLIDEDFDEDSVETGVLDPHGHMIYRVIERNPIGFYMEKTDGKTTSPAQA